MESRRIFQVFVGKCQERGVFFIDHSDIPGLHLEADTMSEMHNEILEIVPILLKNLTFDTSVDEVSVEVFKEGDNDATQDVRSHDSPTSSNPL